MTRCRKIRCKYQEDGHCIGIPCGGADTPPPVQSDQSDEDPHEKDEIWAGIEPFQVNAGR